ncbi:hypothetical protein [Actinoallomurus sp. NPDC050550]|uniref:hypothetical protein n=1 Tax=Actinoallomurus sp. NPDC050550 TaxID=3154937 RepID=UPI0033CA3A5F
MRLLRSSSVCGRVCSDPYGQIAEILQLSEANTRQMVSRARRHLSAGRRTPVSSSAHRRLLKTFLAAARRRVRASVAT